MSVPQAVQDPKRDGKISDNGKLSSVFLWPLIQPVASQKVCSRCGQSVKVSHFNTLRGIVKTYCKDCERTWQTHKIHQNKIYSFGEIVRVIGGSWSTLARWKESGRLICVSTRIWSSCNGQRLIEAIENRLGI